MKYNLFCFLIFISACLNAQNKDSCTLWKLPSTNEVVYFKGLPFNKEVYFSKEFFKNGIALEPIDSAIKLVGYSVVLSCAGCDILGFQVCGNRMDSTFFTLLYKGIDEHTWLEFARINILKEGKRYLAPPFYVYIKPGRNL